MKNAKYYACAGKAKGIPFNLEISFGNKEKIMEAMLKNLIETLAGGIK